MRIQKLSAGQQWRLRSTFGDQSINNIVSVYKILSNICLDKLANAVKLLADAFPILTGSINNADFVYNSYVLNLTDMGQLDSIEGIQRELLEQSKSIYDEPLFQVYFATDQQDTSYLIIRANHLVLDAKSYTILLKKLFELYSDQGVNTVDNLYSEYVDGEKTIRQSKEYASVLNSAARKLKVESQAYLDGTSTAQRISCKVPNQIVNNLRGIAEQNNLTLFSTFYGWFAASICIALANIKTNFGYLFCNRLTSHKYINAVGPFSDSKFIIGLNNAVDIQSAANIVQQSVIQSMLGQSPHLIDIFDKYHSYINILFDYREEVPMQSLAGDIQLQEIPMLSPHKMRRDLSCALINRQSNYELAVRFNEHKITNDAVHNLLENMLHEEYTYA